MSDFVRRGKLRWYIQEFKRLLKATVDENRENLLYTLKQFPLRGVVVELNGEMPESVECIKV